MGWCYTWTNKLNPDSRKLIKLDRVICNVDWVSSFPSSFAEALPSGLSNHSPLIDIFAQIWSTKVSGTAMYQLITHLKMLKPALKKLNAKNYSHLSARVKELQEKLHRCQLQLQVSPTNGDLQEEEADLNRQYCQLKRSELSMLHQRAKEHDIKAMDINSAYCFSKVAFKRNINSISKEADPNVVPELEVINTGPYLTEELQHMLNQNVTPEEIRKALFSIDKNKSPGPDGYSSGFFKQAWGIIQQDFTRAVADFFRTGKLLKEINSTVIALIPKKENANTVLEYRPISCCNTIYKTISKILPNRLKKVLPHLIGQEQVAFVQGRSIFDNTLLTQALIGGYAKKNVSPRCMIKIDIQKAIDSVDLAISLANAFSHGIS
ncbi:uncharacterized protein LOC141640979 [Silene latifolia]|uniref:uncharacterized protein LOC141640979 n=1 Tax=Silene latifolia TaxID=37657 RepID=UPI003D76CC39